MLNNDALNQLAQLKQDIQASKEYATGTVVGSSGRFGFVKLEDGRDAYLPPEKMQRVIPGDTVYVSLVKNKKDKLEAELEKLEAPSLDRFVGQYHIKGSAHFVQPTSIQSSRWIFLPPKARGKCKEGDYVVAKLVNHPFKDTKAAAKILDNIGQESDAKFEHSFIKAKYQLSMPEPKNLAEEVKAIEKQFAEQDFGERTDLSHIPFVTIDAASTQDMDDAIAMEPLDSDSKTMHVHVAIADPTNFIRQDSALAKSSFSKGQTSYLLGGSVAMFPAQLSHHCFSLEPNKQRPALVCHLEIHENGSIENVSFEFAVIESKHKLSYKDVGDFLEANEQSVPEEFQPMLQSLHHFAQVRRQFREKEFLLGQDQSDYNYTLDDNGHIESIEKRPRTAAHTIVEEAMLATNISGAELLKEHKLGLCVAHKGFREERLGEVKALLKEENISHGELNTLEAYVALFHELQTSDNTKGFIPPLRRMMDNIGLSLSAAPHFGMGLAAYATITSPIRRYADLYNHWALRKILCNNPFKPLEEKTLEKLNQTLQLSRQADRELSQWLVTKFTDKLIGYKGDGEIRIVTQHGFGVRLEENGIEGFIQLPKDQEKKYDAKRMVLEVKDEKYFLGKRVSVTIKSVDPEKRRIAFSI